jgi:hypothetical protein
MPNVNEAPLYEVRRKGRAMAHIVRFDVLRTHPAIAKDAYRLQAVESLRAGEYCEFIGTQEQGWLSVIRLDDAAPRGGLTDSWPLSFISDWQGESNA